jgi:hypothetical protein
MPDREKVEEWARSFKAYVDELDIARDDYRGIIEYIEDALALLREHDDCENCAIAIEDRQPVVRCKDCKHYDPDIQICNNGVDGILLPDWFCADGGRR